MNKITFKVLWLACSSSIVIHNNNNNVALLLVQGQSITNCADGTECQNGSTCIRLEQGFTAPNSKSLDGIRSYRCDCSKTTGSLFYAGYECQYQADDYCLYGVNVDTRKSFCTNNGECKTTTSPDDGEDPKHNGCYCEQGFEGDFCEYVMGEAPIKVSTTIARTIFIAFLLIVISLSSIILVFVEVRRRRRTKEGIQMSESKDEGEKEEEGDNNIIIETVQDYKNQIELT